MVAVVQLVEHQVVILAVAGSSPVSHPAGRRAFRPPTFCFPDGYSEDDAEIGGSGSAVRVATTAKTPDETMTNPRMSSATATPSMTRGLPSTERDPGSTMS